MYIDLYICWWVDWRTSGFHNPSSSRNISCTHDPGALSNSSNTCSPSSPSCGCGVCSTGHLGYPSNNSGAYDSGNPVSSNRTGDLYSARKDNGTCNSSGRRNRGWKCALPNIAGDNSLKQKKMCATVPPSRKEKKGL